MRRTLACTVCGLLAAAGPAQAVVRVEVALAGTTAEDAAARCAPLVAGLAAAEPDARIESAAVAGMAVVTARLAQGTAAAASARIAAIARDAELAGADLSLVSEASLQDHVVTLLVRDVELHAAVQRLRRRIAMTPGARVFATTPGGPAVRVEVDLARLAARGLTVSALTEAVRRAAPLRDLDALGALAVGPLVRLGDIAVIRHALAETAVERFEGRPAGAVVVAAERVDHRAALARAVAAAVADEASEVAVLGPGELRRAVQVEIEWRGSARATTDAADRVASRLAGIEGVARVWLRVVGAAVDVAPALVRLPAAGRATALLAPDADPEAVLAAFGDVEGARAHRGDAPRAIAVDVLGVGREAVEAVAAALRGIPGVVAVTSDAHLVERRARVVADATECTAAGVAVDDVEVTGQFALGGVPLGEIGGWPVLLRPADANPDWRSATVVGGDGAEIALGRLANLREQTVPACVRGVGGRPAMRLLVWPAPTAARDRIVRAVTDVELPEGASVHVDS